MNRDYLLSLIYADFEQAIDQVRHGADPEAMFRAHERRVAPLRDMVDDLDRRAWQTPKRVTA